MTKLVSHHGDCSSAVAMWIFLSAQAEKQGLEPGSVGSTGPLFNHTPALEFEFEKVYSHIRLFGSFSPFQPRFASSSCSFFIWTFFVAILRRLTCSVCHKYVYRIQQSRSLQASLDISFPFSFHWKHTRPLYLTHCLLSFAASTVWIHNKPLQHIHITFPVFNLQLCWTSVLLLWIVTYLGLILHFFLINNAAVIRPAIFCYTVTPPVVLFCSHTYNNII